MEDAIVAFEDVIDADVSATASLPPFDNEFVVSVDFDMHARRKDW